jgi:hypothetical protein
MRRLRLHVAACVLSLAVLVPALPVSAAKPTVDLVVVGAAGTSDARAASIEQAAGGAVAGEVDAMRAEVVRVPADNIESSSRGGWPGPC